MSDVDAAAIILTVLAPLVSVAGVGFLVLLSDAHPSERTASRLLGAGLVASVLGSLIVLGGYAGVLGEPVRGDVEFANWLRIGNFVIPTVFLVDGISVTISLFAAVLTALVARFSVTYLHKEAGFVPFLRCWVFRHRHAAGRARRRPRTVLRRLGDDRRIVGLLHRLLS